MRNYAFALAKSENDSLGPLDEAAEGGGDGDDEGGPSPQGPEMEEQIGALESSNSRFYYWNLHGLKLIKISEEYRKI